MLSRTSLNASPALVLVTHRVGVRSVLLSTGFDQHIRLRWPPLYPYSGYLATQGPAGPSRVVRVEPAVPHLDTRRPVLLPVERLPRRRPPHPAIPRVSGLRTPPVLGEPATRPSCPCSYSATDALLSSSLPPGRSPTYWWPG